MQSACYWPSLIAASSFEAASCASAEHGIDPGKSAVLRDRHFRRSAADVKTVVLPTEECIRKAAGMFLSQIEEKPDSTIALDADENVLRVLRCAAVLSEERGIPLRKAVYFAVCEFEGIGAPDPGSAEMRIREALFADAAADETVLSVPDGGDPPAYDERIRRSGGIDLAMLGLGVNARVGFNEPATQYDTNTHVQKLTDKTKRELAPLFGGEDSVPSRGVTMGFRQICSARNILVAAFGEEKSSAVFHMLYGRDDSVYPAAFLQLPPNVTLYADADAASQLGGKSFDAVRFNGD